MGVQCTLFRGLAQIHYGQTQAPFSALLRRATPLFTYLYVPSVIRSLSRDRYELGTWF